MKFMTDDFCLHNDYAKTLYHDYASKMPIFDFHCHLEAKEIYENKNIPNITEARLGGDHYKWRVMRDCGVSEDLITGDGDDYEKFLAYAKVVAQMIGNPLYHWTHLELKNFFGIDESLDENSAKEIYDKCNELLKKDEYRPRGLIEMSNVAAICTTNDPADDLTYHELLEADKSFKTTVRPAFRPDKALYIEKEDFGAYLEKLSKASDSKIDSYESLKAALLNRMDYFAAHGCMASDQALAYVPYRPASDEKVDEILRKALKGEGVSLEEEEIYKTSLLKFLAKEYKDRDRVMEIHIGVIRNTSKKIFDKLGPDVGADAVNDHGYAENLANLFSDFEEADGLPRILLFTLNPKDFYPLATVSGSFNRENEDHLMNLQIGTSRWYLDHKEGMIDQMKIFSQTGVFSKFVGMLTDSRSFLSYPRHEYFRRILCNFLGEFVERGEYPWDEERLGQMVQDISYNNARKFIKIEDKKLD